MGDEALQGDDPQVGSEALQIGDEALQGDDPQIGGEAPQG